jgi:hypothetical protein
VNPDAAWIVIMMEGGESKYLDVPDARVNEVVAFFPSEGDSPESSKRSPARSKRSLRVSVMNPS